MPFRTDHVPDTIKRIPNISCGAVIMLAITKGDWAQNLDKSSRIAQSQGKVGILSINPFIRESANGVECIGPNDKGGDTPPAPDVARFEVVGEMLASRRNFCHSHEFALVLKTTRL